ncbi:cytochrome c biogenesis protein CcsA [Nafulsella turpanensis]|uniref:cytochrome c biogenesis protein CcsA n=1 Tax=Nafulsella turpanensis TaxID=1265690 RepID=UPI0003457FEF|nr:cytochrome c biogenesis protein CcsA [Nafulsella turpanensis]
MIHTFIGDAGHFFIILSFVTSLLAGWAYFQVGREENPLKKQSWQKLGRWTFYLHSFAVLAVVYCLFHIIYNHYFEYHYAWSHSSRSLPVHYMISCFWEGQEGSFLLWIFWQALLGLVLIATNKRWEAPVMVVFALVQAFLVSMILGVVIPGLELKIGSSPFILMRDAMDAPVFQMNPEYVPEDGTGLNPLLQNYWMVIHPPTLFLGFAMVLVPFAYCMAGLWEGSYRDWIRPALPWMSAATLVLGLGILMGAYWAYETLNFGGYWNWDPVENAVYVPWLIMVAALHVMIAFKKNNTALKSAIVLVISSFILILYSTFLTRSGILGESSVHSFTDLGLSGQLLIYLLFFLLLSVVLAVRAWKHIPSSEKEASAYSREFWIFIGATTLCLMGFQVLLPTSIPVYNAIVEAFGGISNVAPPTDPVAFYTNFQLWFAVVVALLSGTGQFFWWQKMDPEKLKAAMVTPLIITLVVGTLALLFSGVKEPQYIILMVAAIYTIVSNFTVLFRLSRQNFKLAGGSVAHIGVAMILLGIMFSSGYSEIVSLNNSGLLYSKSFSDEMNRENILLWLNEPERMKQYELVYKGQYQEVEGVPDYVTKDLLKVTPDPNKVIARGDYYYKGKKQFGEGDTLKVYAENTYYRVEYTDENGEKFTLFPRAQVNKDMGGLLASPDIKREFDRDLYTHVSSIPDPQVEPEWSEPETMEVKIGEQFFINDYVAYLDGVQQVGEVEGMVLQPNDVAVKANIRIMARDIEYTAEPVYIIRTTDGTAGTVPATVNSLAAKVGFQQVDPDTGTFTFTVSTTQKDYIILKAMEKPLINILWTGTLMLMIGFGIAISRRYSEFRKMRDKEVE